MMEWKLDLDNTFDKAREEAAKAREKAAEEAPAPTPVEKVEDTRPITYYGIDGEGYDDTERKCHIYDMLTIGDTTLGSPGKILTYRTIFDAILSHKEDAESRGERPIYQLYYGNYDIVQWIKSFPSSTLSYLGKNLGSSRPVKAGPYSIVYHKGAWIKITESGTGRSVKIGDAGTNFNAPFMDAIKSVLEGELTEEEAALILEGKQARGKTYTRAERVKEWEDILQYNRLECKLLSKMCYKITPILSQVIGTPVPQLTGAGGLASKWIQQQPHLVAAKNILQSIGMDDYLWLNDAYFGGIIETYQFGIMPHAIYNYDINSAYPAAIKELPSLEGATSRRVYTMEEVEAEASKGNLCFIEGGIVSASPIMGAANYRDPRGAVSRPAVARVRMELGEFHASQRAGLVADFVLDEAIVIDLPHGNDRPFASIEDVYNSRLQVGKDTVQGAARKMLIVSVYGKMAQSRGAFKFANPIHAALITAKCRTMILDAIATYPGNWEQDLIAIATDGLYFRGKHDALSLSSTIGEWGEKVYQGGMCVIKNGLWSALDWSENKYGTIGELEFKSRGLSKEAFHDTLMGVIIPALEKMEDEGKWDFNHKVTVPGNLSFMTLGAATEWGKLEQLGEWNLEDREISLSVTPKRSIKYHDERGGFRSVILQGAGWEGLGEICHRTNVIGLGPRVDITNEGEKASPEDNDKDNENEQ